MSKFTLQVNYVHLTAKPALILLHLIHLPKLYPQCMTASTHSGLDLIVSLNKVILK